MVKEKIAGFALSFAGGSFAVSAYWIFPPMMVAAIALIVAGFAISFPTNQE